MAIKPPYGFEDIIPLTKTQRVLLPTGATVPAIFHGMNPMPVSYLEFSRAGRDYPLVFVSGDEGRSFTPMLILGLEPRQNLFVRSDHIWDPAVYLPAYVRRYPFCMTRITIDGTEAPQRVACVEKRAVSRKGEPLFDDSGQPLPDWQQREKLLFEYESDLARTEEMCKLLAEHELLEPFSLQAAPSAGEPLQLTGMYRIAEPKLGALDAEVLKTFNEQGVLGCIYAHLCSLQNFERLLVRRASVVQESAAAVPDKNKLN